MGETPKKRVTVFVGSAGKRHTYHAVERFLANLQVRGDVEGETVILSDYRLGICRGCKGCFERGEAVCPMKDDRDLLIGKMMASDGVVFASPNYSFQVSAVMKIFLDRLGFVFHRPCFFGKAFTSIVVQGIYGGDKIERYLDFVGGGLGFRTVEGTCVTALEPMTSKEQARQARALDRLSRRFYECLGQPLFPRPSLLKLATFRMGRTCMALELDDRSFDYRHYRDQGWFQSDYFYPVRLGAWKKAVGCFFDWLAARMTKARHADTRHAKLLPEPRPPSMHAIGSSQRSALQPSGESKA